MSSAPARAAQNVFGVRRLGEDQADEEVSDLGQTQGDEIAAVWMGIVLTAARQKGVALPLGALTAQLVSALVAQGDGGLDHSALLRGIERLSGQEVSGT